MREIWRYWPVFLIVLGVSNEIDALRTRRGDGGYILIAVGVWMLAGSQEFLGLDYRSAFPLGVVVAGLGVILHALLGVRSEKGEAVMNTTTTDSFRITPRLIIGFGILALGMLWTLDNLDVLESEPITRWWPVVLIVIGLVKLLDRHANRFAADRADRGRRAAPARRGEPDRLRSRRSHPARHRPHRREAGRGTR